ncbi:hypothetical protein A4R26_02895 [Niastella populi]|uniref:Uncharacterized protein n=1 Tax=Niastella populi TaxID=550983 RepID=A0A1V9FJB5_9BACT|nr:hypothetical protein A4R26_02895 [Niastella populi]
MRLNQLILQLFTESMCIRKRSIKYNRIGSEKIVSAGWKCNGKPLLFDICQQVGKDSGFF